MLQTEPNDAFHLLIYKTFNAYANTQGDQCISFWHISAIRRSFQWRSTFSGEPLYPPSFSNSIKSIPINATTTDFRDDQ